MPHARNFNPEWGYVAPAPSFLRATRLVVVAAAIGAMGGAAAVFSLVDRHVAEESVAARTLVRSQIAAVAVTDPGLRASTQKGAPDDGAPPIHSVPASQSVADAPHASAPPVTAAGKLETTRPATGESSPIGTLQRPVKAAALAEMPAAIAAPPLAMNEAPSIAQTPKAPIKKSRTARSRYDRYDVSRYDAPRYGYGYGSRYGYESGPRSPLALLPYGERDY